MLVHFLFENIYFRLLFAFLICTILAFINSLEIFHKKEMFYAQLLILFFIIYLKTYNDYGLILLMIALICMTYNNVTYPTQKH